MSSLATLLGLAMALGCGACARPRSASRSIPLMGKAEEAAEYWSPGGRVRVEFQVDTAAPPDSISGRDGFVKYALVFLNRGGALLAHSDYSEVYVWAPGGGAPEATAAIFAHIGWSPGETVAWLPPERWEGASRTPRRKLVNLKAGSTWKTVSLRFRNARWIDSVDVAGEQPEKCGSDLALFDARTGQTRVLFPGGQGVDYRIDSFIAPNLRVQTAAAECPGTGKGAVASACLQIDIHHQNAVPQPCREK